MAKKRSSWFNLLKRFFLVTDANSRTEKQKDKRRRSWIFGKHKNKRIAAPLSDPSKKIQNDANSDNFDHQEENSTNNQVTVWISGCSSPDQSSIDKLKNNEFQRLSPIKMEDCTPKSVEIQLLAAIKIQTAFRGFLAKKASRALKGVVKLQALIRGWGVRRQAMNTLKRLQTIVNIQTQVCANRCTTTTTTPHFQHYLLHYNNQFQDDFKVDSNSPKRWDDSLLTKEEAIAFSMSKKVAAIKRERIKEYWLNHRVSLSLSLSLSLSGLSSMVCMQRSTESEQNKLSVKQRYWLEKWVDAQLAKREDVQNLDEVFSPSTAKNREEAINRQIKLSNLQKQYQIEALDSPIIVPRRSFHLRKRSIEDGCLGSPAVPTYMAATKSAKAKARSLSSPRPRPIPMDAYSEINSPYKHKMLSPISSINSEMTCNTQINRNLNFSQRSPCLKGIPGPVKSNSRCLKDPRLTLESLLTN